MIFFSQKKIISITQRKSPEVRKFWYQKNELGFRPKKKHSLENRTFKLKAINHNPILKVLLNLFSGIFMWFDLISLACSTCTTVYRHDSKTLNQTIYNIICWFTGPMGQKTHQPSFWRSKYFFFTISYKLFIFIFVILYIL